MVDRYYTEIGKYDLLTPNEEKILAARALLGDKDAADKLVLGNLRFVISVAKQYEGQGVPIEDLISEGNIGLMMAVQRFDPSKKYKFITYASYWIRQAILKALGEQTRTIRLPSNKISMISRINSAIEKLSIILERDPTQEEIEDYLGEDIGFDYMDKIKGRLIYLDAGMGFSEDDSRHFSDVAIDPEQENTDGFPSSILFQEELDYLTKDFTEREKDIIYMYHGVGTGVRFTLEQLGNMYGICRERVRQIKNSALDKLRTHPEIDRLKSFL